MGLRAGGVGCFTRRCLEEPFLGGPIDAFHMQFCCLARQWTLEDEEEQERERRRRHRTLSSATDDEAPRLTQNGDSPAAERLPSVEEAEVPKPRTSVSKDEDEDEDEDVQAILRTRRERRQRRQAVEAAQAPGQPEAGAGREPSGPGQAKQQPLGPSGEQRGPRAGEDESPGGRGSAGGKEEVSGKPALPEKTLAPAERLVSAEASRSQEALGPQKTSAPEKRATPEKRPLLERTGVPEKPPAPGKTSDPERRLVSEKASLFEKSLASEKTPAAGSKLAPRRAGGQPASGGCQPAGQRGRALPDESPPSSAEQGEQRAPEPPTAASSRLPPITLQVKIPSKEGEVDTLSPTQATYSSSLRRSSPRTISFRMSPRRDNPETTLTRSASMRLPAGTAKLGEKLERYHTAVQRSESVKSPGSSRAEFFVAPVGVASKRHLFEKELLGQGRAEVASSRKENLKLSGVVTSRLNLWISRTQESGEQDPQEVGKESVVTKRTQWGRKADSSLDAEVRGRGGLPWGDPPARARHAGTQNALLLLSSWLDPTSGTLAEPPGRPLFPHNSAKPQAPSTRGFGVSGQRGCGPGPREAVLPRDPLVFPDRRLPRRCDGRCQDRPREPAPRRLAPSLPLAQGQECRGGANASFLAERPLAPLHRHIRDPGWRRAQHPGWPPHQAEVAAGTCSSRAVHCCLPELRVPSAASQQVPPRACDVAASPRPGRAHLGPGPPGGREPLHLPCAPEPCFDFLSRLGLRLRPGAWGPFCAPLHPPAAKAVLRKELINSFTASCLGICFPAGSSGACEDDGCDWTARGEGQPPLSITWRESGDHVRPGRGGGRVRGGAGR
uniref:Ladinin 1 n=1 Tax=Canis lupus familiaris TaxID=9615 RepID=A0A8P0TD77_CANLF